MAILNRQHHFTKKEIVFFCTLLARNTIDFNWGFRSDDSLGRKSLKIEGTVFLEEKDYKEIGDLMIHQVNTNFGIKEPEPVAPVAPIPVENPSNTNTDSQKVYFAKAPNPSPQFVKKIVENAIPKIDFTVTRKSKGTKKKIIKKITNKKGK